MTAAATLLDEGTASGVSPADRTQEASLTGILTLAFAADPVVRWIYPGQGPYLRHFPKLTALFSAPSLAAGSAYMHAEEAGVALWLPPGAKADEEAAEALLEESVPEHHRDNVMALFGEMEEFHPGEEHWYLPLIGTDPSRQGEGVGSALLAHSLRRCDADGLPAYLEATCARNVALYARHGFEAMGEIRAGGSPPLTPMWRTPR